MFIPESRLWCKLNNLQSKFNSIAFKVYKICRTAIKNESESIEWSKKLHFYVLYLLTRT